jgi:hypothetical protein
MHRWQKSAWPAPIVSAVCLACLHATAPAQELTRGFVARAAAVAIGEERQRQPDLRVFEVQFKQMRMVWVDITDPKTGERSRQPVWYFAYRTVNRELAMRADETDTTPVNALDPLPGPNQYVPEFSLITYDERGTELPNQVYLDEVLPEAMQAINAIERRRPGDPAYLDCVSIVRQVPDPVPADATDVEWTYGVATWRNVDADADFFKVVMRGFSNGYEVRTGPDGVPVTWRKTLVQKFMRRGDRFDPTQHEFEFDGPPEWVYLPDPAPSGQTLGRR